MKYRPRKFDRYRLKIVYYNCYEIFNNFALAIPIYIWQTQICDAVLFMLRRTLYA